MCQFNISSNCTFFPLELSIIAEDGSGTLAKNLSLFGITAESANEPNITLIIKAWNQVAPFMTFSVPHMDSIFEKLFFGLDCSIEGCLSLLQAK
jgi:hypothetical protein